MTNEGYNTAANFMVSFGFAVTCGIIVFGLIIVGLTYYLWLSCLVDAFRRDEAEFNDRTLWITILLVTLIIPGFFWHLIAAAVYYSLYKPDLKFWNSKK